MSDKIEEFIKATKINELIHKNEVAEKKKNTFLAILAGIGIVALIAGIVYGAYCFFTPDYIDDFDDELDDDFDDDYFDED
ncbi:MAG: DUF4366 domain-containing protein [Lachnospiraceae bacterium]|nr:DUF4366 domain-containing protein [Lachnospiraceae bacterium]